MPNDLDQVAAAAPKNVEIANVRITLQALLNQTRQARCNAIAARNLRHLRPWRQRLLDDPRLVILRPAPSPLQPAQNLDPHRLMTLKLDLRSHASRNTTRQTRRRSSDAYRALNRHVVRTFNPDRKDTH